MLKSRFLYGDFVNRVISFVVVAAAIFFIVVKPMTMLMARRARGEAPSPTTRSCPECLSEIPLAARRCAYCASEVSPAGSAA